MATCSEKCWTPAECPEHGGHMLPFGRSAGLGAYYCCESYADPKLNQRHLWDEHDSTRHYSDPEGWREHEESCAECGTDHDDD